MQFVNEMKKTLGDEFNYAMTENGALGYRTTQSALLDINFQAASLRHMEDKEIARKFKLAFHEDKVLAMKWAFFLRDVRGGLGERRSFRAIMSRLAKDEPKLVVKLIPAIAEYGRWDDVLYLDRQVSKDSPIHTAVVKLVSTTLKSDLNQMAKGESCTLLAKWMPTVTASNVDNRRYAYQWASILFPHIQNTNSQQKAYRKMLASLRKYLDVVEIKMVQNQWDQIDYQTVPSKANLIYKNAFMKHDPDRRTEFLDALTNGEAKINSAVLFPHEIVYKYLASRYSVGPEDATLEGLWNNLPDTLPEGSGNVLVVRDGSGSMTVPVGDGSTTALEVSTALAIYFAERINGQFKDQFITFSSRPSLIDLSNLETLHDKVDRCMDEDDCSNTNIQAVFDLILTTAVRSRMRQEDLPATVLILSDMEFDAHSHHIDERLFTRIAKDYEANGYKLPKLVFWNLNSRTGTIPVTQNEMGVALISGFSTNLAKMVMSNETDPYKILLETLNSSRYEMIGELMS